MADSAWVDSLSEEWISQPRSSPAFTPARSSGSTTGTTRVLIERSAVNGFTPNRHLRPRSSKSHGSVSDPEGTTQMNNSGLPSDVPDWKRKLMDDFGASGPKDLFSPMQLESLFKPPSLGGNSSSPALPPPQRLQQQGGLSKTPKKSKIPIPQSSPFPSALSTLPEEASSRTRVQQWMHASQHKENQRPLSRPTPQKSLIPHRRTHSSPPTGRPAVKNAQAKRKAEKYADIEHDSRSKIILPEQKQSQPPKPRSVRAVRGFRWLKSHGRSSSDGIKRNEITSPLSAGGITDAITRATPLLRRGMSNPEPDLPPILGKDSECDQEQDDILGELRSDFDGPRNVRSFRGESDGSVYPSSPPVLQSHHRRRQEGLHEDSINDGVYLEDSKVSLASPFISPKKSPPSTPRSSQNEKSLVLRKSSPSTRNSNDDSTLLQNIRGHKDAPKSPVKMQAAVHQEMSSEDEEEPFFTPHPFRFQSEPLSTTPRTPASEQRESDSKQGSGSPLKLFSGIYDTYTNEKLRKRLGELEESVEQGQPIPKLTFDRGSDDGWEGESSRSFPGRSVVVSRLEAIARKEERRNSPSQIDHIKRQLQELQSAETVEKVVATTTSARVVSPQRRVSAPETSTLRSPPTSGRKHRRWRSDESTPVPNDGVAGPRSPVKERTPKRARRSTFLGTPQPSFSSIVDSFRPETPGSRRRRVNAGIEEGSILASSRRQVQQRSRANSRVSARGVERILGRTESSTPTPKKRHTLGGGDQLSPVPAISTPMAQLDLNSQRIIVFGGKKGSGLEGESFEMPSPASKATESDGAKGTVTTQDFLQQAEEVMERIRALGLQTEDYSSEPEGESKDELQPPKRENANVADRIRNVSLFKKLGGAHNLFDKIPLLKLPDNQTPRLFCPDGRERDELKACLSLSHSLKSSRSSRVSVIPNGPEVAAHCLATRDMYDMTFDNNTLAWISRDPTKQSEDDPFREISDLSVDSKEEERVLEQAAQQWMALGSSPDSMEKSGVWRSSRLIDNGENEEWNEAPWSGSLALSSSVGSGFSHRSVDSAFEVPPRTETRTTSYGTDEMNKDVKRVEVDQDEHAPEPGENREGGEQGDADESVVEIPKPAIFADDGFLSSPLRNEIYMDEDGNFDGFLDHGSLRQPGRSGVSSSLASLRNASRRKSSGKTIFTGRPVSRIEEEEEASRAGQKVLHPDLEQELRRLSLGTALTPVQTPFRSSLSIPPSTKKKDVSFYLSPLPDLSYRFETTEALISLELSYITSRRGPKATPKAVEASFSIAQENLVKHLTDVEPYDPYWDFIKCLKLAGRKIETLYTLNEWCPRLAELDVSNNDLGQLTGLPDSIMNLSVRLNNLTNVTFFGHLTNLQSLDVSGNGLENLDALKMCRHLREIKADDNVLTSINGVFEIGGLMSLRCRRNKLESVDLSKCELKCLKELDLRGNSLASVTGLECLPSLIHLNLDQNRLSSLPTLSGFKLESIRSIKLTQNLFTTFDLAPFPNLRILYMDNNHLSSIASLGRCKSLDALSLRDQLTSSGIFELDLNHMFEVRKLYLSSNPVSSLDNISTPFLNLQFLEIAETQLRQLPRNFAELFPNLRVLNLNHNAVSDLRPLSGLTRLVKLSAAGNRISNLKRLGQSLFGLRHLKYLDLRSNPVTLGFYPPPPPAPAATGGDDEYPCEPFELPSGSEEEDKRFWGKVDMYGKCERRTYEVVLAAACGRKLKIVDGLVFVREEVEADDEVWREMVIRGMVMVRETDGETQRGGVSRTGRREEGRDVQ